LDEHRRVVLECRDDVASTHGVEINGPRTLPTPAQLDRLAADAQPVAQSSGVDQNCLLERCARSTCRGGSLRQRAKIGRSWRAAAAAAGSEIVAVDVVRVLIGLVSREVSQQAGVAFVIDAAVDEEA
jgi:hypothetical protein